MKQSSNEIVENSSKKNFWNIVLTTLLRTVLKYLGCVFETLVKHSSKDFVELSSEGLFSIVLNTLCGTVIMALWSVVLKALWIVVPRPSQREIFLGLKARAYKSKGFGLSRNAESVYFSITNLYIML